MRTDQACEQQPRQRPHTRCEPPEHPKHQQRRKHARNDADGRFQQARKGRFDAGLHGGDEAPAVRIAPLDGCGKGAVDQRGPLQRKGIDGLSVGLGIGRRHDQQRSSCHADLALVPIVAGFLDPRSGDASGRFENGGEPLFHLTCSRRRFEFLCRAEAKQRTPIQTHRSQPFLGEQRWGVHRAEQGEQRKGQREDAGSEAARAGACMHWDHQVAVASFERHRIRQGRRFDGGLSINRAICGCAYRGRECDAIVARGVRTPRRTGRSRPAGR